MKNMSWKFVLSLALAALFTMGAQIESLAQGRGGGQRPPKAQRGQRPNRENSPYADKWKNGQRRPDNTRGNGSRPQGTFPRN